ncbi:MAG: serine/threonine protein phosphatase, partial [Myxococcota bacterium]|nr:serine/threonine protein phosphatase [Myxococcota bacterium]
MSTPRRPLPPTSPVPPAARTSPSPLEPAPLGAPPSSPGTGVSGTLVEFDIPGTTQKPASVFPPAPEGPPTM